VSGGDEALGEFDEEHLHSGAADDLMVEERDFHVPRLF
jgi:hypothetical protein